MRIVIIVLVLCGCFVNYAVADNTPEINQILNQSQLIRQKIEGGEKAIRQLRLQLIKNEGKIELLKEQDMKKLREFEKKVAEAEKIQEEKADGKKVQTTESNKEKSDNTGQKEE